MTARSNRPPNAEGEGAPRSQSSDRGGLRTALERLTELGAHLEDRPYAKRGIPTSNETIRVLLVNDHAIVREGLRLLLHAPADIAVVGECAGGAQAVVLARQLLPDVVVLDLNMPEGDGTSALRELQRLLPRTRVLILTMHPEPERLLPVLEMGARGFLTKEAASLDLVEAIRVVASGEVYVRPAAARLLAAALVPQRVVETAHGRFVSLSQREQTVLRSVAQGFSGAEIARGLGISAKTVDAYKRRVEDKLGLRHRTDYVRFALEAGILISEAPAPPPRR